MKCHTTLCCLLFFLLPITLHGQERNSQKESVHVFLDCDRCDRSFIRKEITFVNFMRDQNDADLHILITGQGTGGGGTEYTLRFLGRGRFQGRADTLMYTASNSDTRDETRQGLLRSTKIGLLPYLSRTEVIDNLSVTYREQSDPQASPEKDRWNHWVFGINGRSSFNGEESRNFLFVSLGASADRVTPETKINASYNYNLNRRSFTELNSAGDENTTVFTTRSQHFNGLAVKSLDEHWSAGIAAEALTSSRNNIDAGISGSPAIEYNIYPYEEYATHEISFTYLLRTGYFEYEEPTIYNKRSELLLSQELRGHVSFTQPWGEIESEITASAYMHDFTKNRVDINLEFDFRVFRGLSLNISGRYSLINDQLSIPKGDISDHEQLLNLRQQATSYSYHGSIGIEYSFGSIYNNVVNPRF